MGARYLGSGSLGWSTIVQPIRQNAPRRRRNRDEAHSYFAVGVAPHDFAGETNERSMSGKSELKIDAAVGQFAITLKGSPLVTEVDQCRWDVFNVGVVESRAGLHGDSIVPPPFALHQRASRTKTARHSIF